MLFVKGCMLLTCYAKYVDDTTVLSVSKYVYDVALQTAADYLVSLAHNNVMMINTNKTKELIQYNTNKSYIAPGILKRIGAQTHGVTRR